MTGVGAGMTEVVVRCSDGAAHGEIPAASAGMTEVGAGRTEVGTGMTKKRGGWGARGRGMGGRSGLLRCGWSWVWAPDQVWGDGSWGWGLRWYGAGSRSGAGMTEVVRCSDGAAHVEIPAASAGMTEVGQEWRRDGVGITGGRGGMGRRGLCGGEVLQMDVGVWFGPSVLRRGLGWAPDQVWGDGQRRRERRGRRDGADSRSGRE